MSEVKRPTEATLATTEATDKREATPEATHQRPTEATLTGVKLTVATLTEATPTGETPMADVTRAFKICSVLTCLFSNKL